MEYSVDFVHRASDISMDKEIADGGFEVFGSIEVGGELFGGFIGVDECSDGDLRIGKEEGDEMATLLSVCEGHKNNL